MIYLPFFLFLLFFSITPRMLVDTRLRRERERERDWDRKMYFTRHLKDTRSSREEKKRKKKGVCATNTDAYQPRGSDPVEMLKNTGTWTTDKIYDTKAENRFFFYYVFLSHWIKTVQKHWRDNTKKKKKREIWGSKMQVVCIEIHWYRKRQCP